MKTLLEALLPRFQLEAEPKVIAFEGKADLERNIARKMGTWRDAPGIEPRFIVMRDNDGSVCKDLKARLKGHCLKHGHPFLVRIVMQELEAWLLGDLMAVDAAYPGKKIAAQAGKAKYRDPDKVANAAEELKKLTQRSAKIGRVEDIAPHMNLEENTSVSFKIFCEGVRKLAKS